MPKEKTAYKISYAETFKCFDCGETFRDGMFPETDFYLDSLDKCRRCIYCYNLKTSSPCKVKWFIDVADRLEHENEVRAFTDLYIIKYHDYYTDHKYRLVVRFSQDDITKTEISLLRKQLVKDGMNCGEISSTHQRFYWIFTIDFADHERIFTR